MRNGTEDNMEDKLNLVEEPKGWHRAAAFLKRFWAISLVVLVPLIPEFVGIWGMNNPFPAIPDIITEAEIGEISIYVDEWSAAYDQPVNWVREFDLDGDGRQEARVHAFRCPEPDRMELYVHTSMEIPGLWQLLTGQCGFAPQGESLAVQDGRTALRITVSGETAGDRSELRRVVEQALTSIREDMADGAVNAQPLPPSPLEKLLQGVEQTEE